MTALPAQRSDTTLTKAALLAADRAMASDFTRRGASALIDRLAPDAAVLMPDAAILHGAAEARAPWLARYGQKGWRIEQQAQHAVANSDGTFGCTVGVSRLFVDSDSSKAPRQGRYVACWQRASLTTVWRMVAYARSNDAPGTVAPELTLDRPPHSATSDGSAASAASLASTASEFAQAQSADSAFAAMSSRSGPGAAFAEWASADAMMLGGAPKPRRGPATIRDAFKNFPKDGVFVWAPVRTLGAGAGGLAVTIGEAHNTVGGKTNYTKYITIWRHDGDAGWKFIFDSGSDRPADAQK